MSDNADSPLLSSQKEKVARLRADERATLSQRSELICELKRIPHLPLKLEIDLQSLLQEAHDIQEYKSHELHKNKGLPSWYYEHHRKSFRGQCLVDYTESGSSGMLDAEGYLFEEPDAQFDNTGRLRFFDTEWGTKMQKSLQTLRQMSPYLNRTRLISTPPGGGIYWHSHHNNIYQNSYLRLAVIILTLETNSECMHGVRDYRDTKSQPQHLHYQPGTAYLFNSWHDHDFWNHGQSDRITLISYLNFPDNDFLDFLETSVNQYSGPRFEKDDR